MKKIVVTGGSGRFGSVLKKFKTKHKMFFPTKKELNILDLNNIKSYLKRKNQIFLFIWQVYQDLWRNTREKFKKA